METFTTDNLLLLNEFAKGFTEVELNKMDLSDSDVVESFGAVDGYSAGQLSKIFEKIKSYKSVPAMTGVDLLALGNLAPGMTATDIAAINKDHFE